MQWLEALAGVETVSEIMVTSVPRGTIWSMHMRLRFRIR